jgi:hypothetical protein
VAAVEFVPAVVVAAIGGIGLGAVVALFAEPALGLPALLGTPDLGPVDVSPVSMAPVLAAVLAVMAAAALGCMMAGRRLPLDEAARE